VPEELEPLLEWFGHGVVDGVVVDGVVVDGAVVDGVVVDGVVVVEAAPDTTVPRPRPRPIVLPAMPMPSRNFLRDDVTLLCSLALIRPPDRGVFGRDVGGRTARKTPEHADLRAS
jgi:hypothetical protein